MNVAFKHISAPEVVIDKTCYDKISYIQRVAFKPTNDKPRYKLLEEKGERLSFTPISR